jgi:sugar O-acyltransferase (sialic acid O-acetyltransferase NeuD family)
MKRLAIYGTGGFAREMYELISAINQQTPKYTVIGWLDDNPEKRGASMRGLPILGSVQEALATNSMFEVVIAIGSTPLRRRIGNLLLSLGIDSPTLVAPYAWIGGNVEIGPGTIVCAGCNITTDIRIGRQVILNLSVTVGHDAVLEDFVTVAPSVNISGNVLVGEGTDLGTGTAIIQGIRIGSWSIIGAGAVVARDVPNNVTAVGVPAKTIKERPAGWHEAV